MSSRSEKWQPALRPFGVFSFIPPEGEFPPVDGREPEFGVTDAKGRPVWRDANGDYWAGPWYAEAATEQR
jgi:hypothetical protein